MNLRNAEFFKELRNGNNRLVAHMLKRKDVKPDIRDLEYPTRPTPLIIATEQNNETLVEILLRYKPDVDLEDKSGKRPVWSLGFAIDIQKKKKNGESNVALEIKFDMFSCLYEAHIFNSMVSGSWAVKYENLIILEMLLKRKAKVNYLDKEMGCTPLYLAILKNHAVMAQMLVHGGADVNLRRLGFDALSESPLIKAVQQNNIAIVRLLINCLADINAPNKDGLSPLHYAIGYRRFEIAEVLLQAKIQMYAASNHGVTAMTVAVEHDVPYMVRLLCQYGYDLKRVYDWGETPLEQAISLHSSNAAKALLLCGVPMNLRREKPRYSYFEHAVAENQLEVSRLILLIRPTFAQERWIREKRFPLSIYHRPDFRKWLEKRAFNPPTLLEWCRSAIFRYLRTLPLKKIQSLKQIPRALRRYLQFDELVKTKKLYRKIPLTEKECPLDCPYYCPQQMCPPLDIEPFDRTVF